MEKKLSMITMSSAVWERHEQRHLRREKRLCKIIVVLIIALLVTGLVKFELLGNAPENNITATVGE